MKKYNIKDTAFAHAYCCSWWHKPTYFEWNRNLVSNDICFYTDGSMLKVSNRFKINIGWVIEPPHINLNYNWIKENYNLFDMVMTYDEELLSMSEKFKLCPIGGCWIKVEDQKIYDKTKNTSIIASFKTMAVGHQLRHKVISKLRSKNYMDVYGNGVGYNKIENKITGLKDYRFSVVIENGQMNYYFTEKLLDCFITGTIPIYWGCPKISKFFNTDGIIIFNSVEELENILKNLTEAEYNNRLMAVKENFELSKQYLIPEDYIYKNYLINL